MPSSCVLRSIARIPSVTSKKWYGFPGHLECLTWAHVVQWMFEVLRYAKGVPYYLVGSKKELRYHQRTIEELEKTRQHPVTPEEVIRIFRPMSATQTTVQC